ncbi:hypothetical protein RMCBS344292_17372 [Rhizopus microsporus]|nr:hypothetical protein RMCBS344292_17372 [Rhizopus microsporus]
MKAAGHTLGANRSSGTAIPPRLARARFRKKSDNLPENRDPITSPSPGDMNVKPISPELKPYTDVYKGGSIFSMANMPPNANPVAMEKIKTKGCLSKAYL